MSITQTWDPKTYAKNARFVSDLGSPVLELLSPQPGERILDLGCGDGVLTKKLAELGCEVVAVDSSALQVEAARRLGLEAYVMNGEELLYREEFDAVFSNAVLHWIQRADVMIEGVYRSLRPGGASWQNAAAMDASTKSARLWFKPSIVEVSMASRVCRGIFQLLETTQLVWNVRGSA